MEPRHSGTRVGIYVDVENISRNGGRGMRFEVLRNFAIRDGAEPVRLNAYLAYDHERARNDTSYREGAVGFHFALREEGFKVIEKPVRWFSSDDGTRVSKANSDLDLAVDMLLQSTRLDRVLLVSGDGDFSRVVRALQDSGCRVEVLAFENVSYDLRCEADVFVSGYLIPGLVPSMQPRGVAWGEARSSVRGTCYSYRSDRGFGFVRYLIQAGDLTLTDTRDPSSPYRSAFFHISNCAPEVHPDRLPSRDMVFEFALSPGRSDTEGLEAKEIKLVMDYDKH